MEKEPIGRGPRSRTRRRSGGRPDAFAHAGPELFACVLAAARALAAGNARVKGRTVAHTAGEEARPLSCSREPLRVHPRERSKPQLRMRQREFCESARGTIRSLRRDLRVPLLLRAERDLSYREIAQLLDTGVEAVGLRVHLAREEIRSRAGSPAPRDRKRPAPRATEGGRGASPEVLPPR